MSKPLILMIIIQICIIIIKIKGFDIENHTVINKEFFDVNSSKIILLKSDHYWIVNCQYMKAKDFKYVDQARHVKPTLVLPYINMKFNNEIKKICKNSDIDGNICFKAMSIYSMTSIQSPKHSYVENRSLKGVVDRLTCKVCKEQG